MKNLFLLLLVCCLVTTTYAQDLYTIKVGTFRDVKADDFTALKAQGFIYGISGADNTTDVYVGHFSDQVKAMTTARTMAANGFRNAQAFVLSSATGQSVTVIQIALYSGTRPIDWATLERAGQLYVETVDGTTKVLTGIYPDARTAANFLPAIRALGYTDAFVRSINNVRLVPITTFETGIKKPLIPLSLQTAKNTEVPLSPSPNPVSAGSGGAAPSTQGTLPSAPTTYNPPLSSNSPQPYNPPVTAAPNTGAASFSLPAGANAPNLPAIDGKIKRLSSADLQRVLKEKGYYSGEVDGYYGPGTAAAYQAAWDGMPEIRKYRKLTEMATEPAGGRDLVSQWPEIQTLLAITEDLSAGMANDTRARQLVQQRAQLSVARQPLNETAASRVNNWATTIWTNLEDWATEDPLHAQMFSAFRLSYYQSQVRLEDHYMDQGLSPMAAKDLATAMLQNLSGAQLDRFL
ncbi:peptidoglycan-binding protein [Neolewinella persica]|uniref:peptidoglycan-binding protein n=1 Tax=Neolewinella persica TaxID=70998 RepID=UPI00037EFB9A|nr:peptidoglycan-binding protein [Neolewinella persica]